MCLSCHQSDRKRVHEDLGPASRCCNGPPRRTNSRGCSRLRPETPGPLSSPCRPPDTTICLEIVLSSRPARGLGPRVLRRACQARPPIIMMGSTPRARWSLHLWRTLCLLMLVIAVAKARFTLDELPEEVRACSPMRRRRRSCCSPQQAHAAVGHRAFSQLHCDHII